MELYTLFTKFQVNSFMALWYSMGSLETILLYIDSSENHIFGEGHRSNNNYLESWDFYQSDTSLWPKFQPSNVICSLDIHRHTISKNDNFAICSLLLVNSSNGVYRDWKWDLEIFLQNKCLIAKSILIGPNIAEQTFSYKMG